MFNHKIKLKHKKHHTAFIAICFSVVFIFIFFATQSFYSSISSSANILKVSPETSISFSHKETSTKDQPQSISGITPGTTLEIKTKNNCSSSCEEETKTCLSSCPPKDKTCAENCHSSKNYCIKNCQKGAELTLEENGRIYLSQDTILTFEDIKTEKNEISINLKSGHLWLRSPQQGKINFIQDNYSLTLQNGSSAEIECNSYNCIIYSGFGYATLSYHLTPEQKNTLSSQIEESFRHTLQGSDLIFNLFTHQKIIIPRNTELNPLKLTTQTTPPTSLTPWTQDHLNEDQINFNNQIKEINSSDLFLPQNPNPLKEKFSYLIIDPNKKEEVLFSSLDKILHQAQKEIKTSTSSSSPSQTLKKFSEKIKELSQKNKPLTEKYLLSRWNLVKNFHTPPLKEITPPSSTLYLIKKTLEEELLKLNPDYWKKFTEQNLFLFEYSINTHNLSSAEAILKSYQKSILSKKNKTNLYPELQKHFLYLSALLHSESPSFNYDLLHIFFSLDQTILTEILPQDLSEKIGAYLLPQKINLIQDLWFSEEKILSSRFASAISGNYLLSSEPEPQYLTFWEENYDTFLEKNPILQTIFTPEKENLFLTIQNYKFGKNSFPEPNKDTFTSDFYTQYLEHLSQKNISKPLPIPSTEDALQTLSEIGIKAKSSQISPILPWIEIQNQTNQNISLSTKELKTIVSDLPTSYSFPTEKFIPPHEKLTFKIDPSTLSLPRYGAKLSLQDLQEDKSFEVNYPYINKGLTYSLLPPWIEIKNNTSKKFSLQGCQISQKPFTEKQLASPYDILPDPSHMTIKQGLLNPSESYALSLKDFKIDLNNSLDFYLYCPSYPTTSNYLTYSLYSPTEIEIKNYTNQEVELSEYFLAPANYSPGQTFHPLNKPSHLTTLSPHSTLLLTSEQPFEDIRGLQLYENSPHLSLHSSLSYTPTQQPEILFGYSEPTPQEANLPLLPKNIEDQTSSQQESEKLTLTSFYPSSATLSDLVISEIYPYDPFRFHLKDIPLEDLTLSFTFDLETLTFSEITASPPHHENFEKWKSSLGPKFEKEINYVSLLLIPQKFKQYLLSLEEPQHSAAPAKKPSSPPPSSETSLKILKNLIIEQLFLQEIYTTPEDIQECNTSPEIPDSERYTTCNAIRAWIIDPHTKKEIYFNLSYNKNTLTGSNIILEKDSYSDFPSSLTVEKIPPTILEDYRFIILLERTKSDLIKELKNWGIIVKPEQLQYVEKDLRQFTLTNATIRNKNNSEGEPITLSAIYDTPSKKLWKIIFEEERIVSGAILKEEFPEVVEEVYN